MDLRDASASKNYTVKKNNELMFAILRQNDSREIDAIKSSEMLVAPRISECFGLGLL